MSTTPTFEQIVEALKLQVVGGRSYAEIASGLLRADPVLLESAPTFFWMIIDGSLELSQMAVARLYDKSGKAMSVPKMLNRAEADARSFRRCSVTDVTLAVAECRKRVVGLGPVLRSISGRRNGWLAHLDARGIADPRAMERGTELTVSDLELAFKATEEIVLKMCSLYEDAADRLEVLYGDDYQRVLHWMNEGWWAFIERCERKTGVPWQGQRPRDSRKISDL